MYRMRRPAQINNAGYHHLARCVCETKVPQAATRYPYKGKNCNVLYFDLDPLQRHVMKVKYKLPLD